MALRVLGCLLISLCPLIAQDGVSTRAGEIEKARRDKAGDLTPDVPPKPERIIRKIQHGVLEDLFGGWHGLRLSLGGMYPRSGFAFGPQYFRPDLVDGKVQFRADAKVSFRKFAKGDIELNMPSLLHDRFFANLRTVYRNYPSVDYYGPGPNSSKTGRTDYRLEDTTFETQFGVRPLRHLNIGGTGGYLVVNIGPGKDDRFASASDVYTEVQTPGIQYQSNFLFGGPFVQFDYRDRPNDPHRGGNYVASFVAYQDRKLDIYNFRRLTAEVQQYVPFLNEKRVFAVRARTELSYRNAGVPIPFYLQPRLGGSEDLRGYRVFRFYDDNAFFMNGEYRWEVMSGFDMALFADAGKVFQSKANLNFADMRTDAGFGLRFSTRDSVFMRWDIGFSQEGFQVWIKFGNVF